MMGKVCGSGIFGNVGDISNGRAVVVVVVVYSAEGLVDFSGGMKSKTSLNEMSMFEITCSFYSFGVSGLKTTEA